MKNTFSQAEGIKIKFVLFAVFILLTFAAISARGSAIQLTPAEQVWLKEHPKIVLGTVPGWEPVSMRDKSGYLSGIAGSYKTLMEKKLPLNIELAPDEPWGAVLENVRNKKVDVVMLLGQTPARDKYLLFTDVLVDIPYVIITRTDADTLKGIAGLTGKRVSVRSHFVSHEWLAANHPEIGLFPRETTKQALEAVLVGEVDAYIGSLAEVGEVITKFDLVNLKVAADASFVNHLRIGVRNDWPELVTILNKAIADITPKEHNAVWTLWVHLDKGGIDERIVYAIIGCFLLVIITGHVIYVVRLRKSNIEQTNAEIELKRLNRILTLQSECNHLLVKVADEENLLHSVCQLILDVGGYALTQVGEQTPNAAGVKIEPRVLAVRSPIAKTFLTPDIMAESPCNRAIVDNEIIIINDISQYKEKNRWTAATLDKGCNAVIALPLRFSRDTDAVLSIYAEKAGSFAGSEVKLLKKLSENLSFGVRTIRDRNKRETAEQLVQESEIRFRSLAQTANDAIISIDSSGAITFWNGEASKIFGYTEEEMIGRNITLIIPERYHALHRAGIERVVAGGPQKIIGSTVELEGTRKGGKEFSIEISLAMWEVRGKKNFTAIIRDITGRKKAENELKKSRQLLADAQAMAHLGTWEMDLRTGKATWSDESYRIFGFAPRAFEPTFDVFDKLVHPDDRKEVEIYLQRVLSGKLSQAEFDVRIIRPDGEVRVINDKLEVITDDDGKPVKITGINFDITERVLYERKLELANEELKVALEQLRESRNIVMRSEKLAAVGTLSAGVAHEILNPLNIISTICQLLLLDERRGRVHDHLNEIMLQIQRAAKITNSLRMFAREKRVDITTVNINALFDHTVALMEHDLNLDNIFIERQYDPDTPLIMADPDQLAQVFMNLLTNARDALKPRRSGIITVATKPLGNGLEFRFHDNGPGIPAEVLDRIFDPFYTTKEPGSGTGLGLSITHRIIEDHGGTIKVESRAGEWTCFAIYLPKDGSHLSSAKNAPGSA